MHDNFDKFQRLHWPSLVLIGPGALSNLESELKKIQCTKVCIVTDKMLVKMGIADQVVDVVRKAGLPYIIFDDVMPNPTIEGVNKGFAVLEESKADIIIAVGGGSPMDTAKAMGILKTNGGRIEDYAGLNKSKHKSMPIVTVATTAGSGSEVTIAYVITDHSKNTKLLMVDDNCTATIAVIDPLLMLGKPKRLTAETGMDAFTHAVEAYTSKNSNPFMDIRATDAIATIYRALPKAVENGADIKARSSMAAGSYSAAIAFSNSGLGLVHAMAHQLGGFFNVAHGFANAILLPHVMEYNLDTCASDYKDLAGVIGIDIEFVSDRQGAINFINAVKTLSVKVGIPSKLTGIDVNEEILRKLAKQAEQDTCYNDAPKKASIEEMVAIYKKIF